MKWLIYALLAMVFFSVMVLIFKKLTIKGVQPSLMLFLLFICAALFYGLHVLVFSVKDRAAITPSVMTLIFLAALLSYAGNLFQIKSIEASPNPGFTIGIVSLQAVFIAIGSVLLFNSSFSSIKILGIVLAVIALVLLGI